MPEPFSCVSCNWVFQKQWGSCPPIHPVSPSCHFRWVLTCGPPIYQPAVCLQISQSRAAVQCWLQCWHWHIISQTVLNCVISGVLWIESLLTLPPPPTPHLPISAKSAQAAKWEEPKQKEQRTKAKDKEAQIPPVHPTRPKAGAQWDPYGLCLRPTPPATAAVLTPPNPQPAATTLQLSGHLACTAQVCGSSSKHCTEVLKMQTIFLRLQDINTLSTTANNEWEGGSPNKV